MDNIQTDIYIVFFIIAIYFIFNRYNFETFNHGERYYAPKEAGLGCGIYGCDIQGNTKFKTYEPIVQQSNYFIGDTSCIKPKEIVLGNYYPIENTNNLLDLNSSAIIVNTGLAVIKENILEAIDIANKDITILDLDTYKDGYYNKILKQFNLINNQIKYYKEKSENIIPFALYLIKIINSVSDGFHIIDFKKIDENSIHKSISNNQIRLEFDMRGRYKFHDNNKYDILIYKKNIIDSLTDLIIHVELLLTKLNNKTYIYVNNMYLVGIHNITPNK